MDCSVSKRKGCNYCLRGKDFSPYDNLILSLDDENTFLRVEEFKGEEEYLIPIQYCLICGREFSI